jgi:hypothetical protein
MEIFLPKIEYGHSKIPIANNQSSIKQTYSQLKGQKFFIDNLDRLLAIVDNSENTFAAGYHNIFRRKERKLIPNLIEDKTFDDNNYNYEYKYKNDNTNRINIKNYKQMCDVNSGNNCDNAIGKNILSKEDCEVMESLFNTIEINKLKKKGRRGSGYMKNTFKSSVKPKCIVVDEVLSTRQSTCEDDSNCSFERTKTETYDKNAKNVKNVKIKARLPYFNKFKIKELGRVINVANEEESKAKELMRKMEKTFNVFEGNIVRKNNKNDKNKIKIFQKPNKDVKYRYNFFNNMQ